MPRVTRRTLEPSTKLLIKQGLIGFVLLVFVSTLLTGVWYGTRAEAVTIQHVTVSGGDTLDHDQIEAAVQEMLEGSYARLVPRRFAWMYPEADILRTLRERFDRMQTAAMEVDGQTLSVTVTEYAPAALWCSDEDETRCVFLDAAGFGFAPAPVLVGGSLPRFISTTEEPATRTQFSSASVVSDITWFLQQAQSILGLYVHTIRLYPDDHITLVISGDRELRLSLRRDITVSFRYLETLLTSQEYAHLQEDDFQYIDLRFGNRLYVNETERSSEVATSTATSTETDIPPREPETETDLAAEPVPDGGAIVTDEIQPAITAAEEAGEPVPEPASAPDIAGVATSSGTTSEDAPVETAETPRTEDDEPETVATTTTSESE